MARTIFGQIVAGTGIDSHGQRLSEDDLTVLSENWPEHLPTGVNHDLAQCPACRCFNKRLERQEDGELALVVDVEVFDEARFAEFGGFSISFSRQRVRIGYGEPVCEVSVNPRQFDFEGLVAAVKHSSLTDACIDVVERVERADVLVTAVISIAVFVGLQTFGGFFNAVGAKLFDLLSKRRRMDELSGHIQVQYHLYLTPARRVPVVILVVEPECRPSDIRLVDGENVVHSVEARFGVVRIQRVVGRIHAGGVVEICHVTTADGRVTYRRDGDG
jgi:hypothetical protein